MTRRNYVAADLRTPKYRPRVCKDRKKEQSRKACRER